MWRNDWQRVADYVGTRNPKQIRWHANELRKKAANNIKSVPADLYEFLIPSRDIWQIDEVTRLEEALKLFGRDENWYRIAKYIQTKTVSQIRNCVKRIIQQTNGRTVDIDLSFLGESLSSEFRTRKR